MASRKTNQRFIAWSIVVIVLLLATNAYQWWHSIQLSKKLDLHKNELAAVEQMQGQLEKDYDLALTSLEELKGDNADLNQMIETQKAELKSQKNRITSLIWKSKQYDQAKKEIDNLKNQALQYIEEINILKTEKESLVFENTALKTRTQTLQSTLNVVSTEKDSLTKVKDFISKEKDSINLVKEQLKKENETLAIKATRAAMIEVLEIDVNGYKIRENGKLRKQRQAKNINLLNICFKLIPNELADGDTEMFYIRLIGPTGETLFKKQLGAGIFNKTADGTETKYTLAANFNMPLAEEVVCIDYEHKETLLEGMYVVEIYNKGYLAGSGSFKLR